MYVPIIGLWVVGILNSKTIIRQCYFWRTLNSPFNVVICVELFLGFLRFSPKENKNVNMIAKSMFGINLLHSNRIIINYMLSQIFPVWKEANSLLVFLYSVGFVATVFAACCIIDIIRMKTVEKIWVGFLDRNLCGIEEKTVRLLKKAYMVGQNVLHEYYR